MKPMRGRKEYINECLRMSNKLTNEKKNTLKSNCPNWMKKDEMLAGTIWAFRIINSLESIIASTHTHKKI